jgi:serine protease Do
VTRGRLGVTVQDVNATLADSFGLDRARGALVSSVDDDGPAEKAGLLSGDIILKFDGNPVERSSTCRCWWPTRRRASTRRSRCGARARRRR